MLEATLPQKTVGYLNQVLGGESVRVAPRGKTAQLPYFLQDTYEVLPCELLGQPITLACLKGRQPLAPQQMDQHAKRLRELLHAPVIFALPEIAPGERKQLIAHGVASVIWASVAPSGRLSSSINTACLVPSRVAGLA